MKLKSFKYVFVLLLISSALYAFDKSKADSLNVILKSAINDSVRVHALLDLGEVYEEENPDTALWYYNEGLKISVGRNNNSLAAKCSRYIAYLYGNILEMPDMSEKYYIEAVKFYTAQNDLKSAANCYLKTAFVFENNVTKSIEYFSKALKEYEKINDRENMAKILGSMGVLYNAEGNTETAIEYIEKSVRIYKELGNDLGVAKGLSNIGNALSDIGEYDKSLSYFNDASGFYVELSDSNGIANICLNIGRVLKMKGSFKEAKGYYHKALIIYEELENYHGMANCYNNIANVLSNEGNYTSSIEYYSKSLDISQKLDDESGKATTYLNIGTVFSDQGRNDSAIVYYLKSLKIHNKLGDKSGTSLCYINIGICYQFKGEYNNASENYFKALNIAEEIGDKNKVSSHLLNIGSVYMDQKEYDEALKYFERSLKIKEEIDDRYGIARCYSYIGDVYSVKNNPDQAISCYIRSLAINMEIGAKSGISRSYNDLGEIYMNIGNNRKALDYFYRALQLNQELDEIHKIAKVCNNIASIHLILADSLKANFTMRKIHLDSALNYGKKAMELSEKMNSPLQIYYAAQSLRQVYKEFGDYAKALDYAELFITIKDSIFSEDKTKALAEMGAKYKSEKKQLEIENLNKENDLKKAELVQSEEKRNRQLVMIYSFVLGFIIILVFSVILFRLFLQKKKANILLAEQKEQIELQNSNLQQANEEINAQRDEIASQRDLVMDQKDRIEEQKNEIEDSIRYAKRIQNAVLPSDHSVQNILSNHFILFRPKDVVSGDFYWVSRSGNWTIAAVADCTGHGVPGAFMSMLGISFLNEIVRKNDFMNTGNILNDLRTSIIDALKQTGEAGTQKDGMDISIIAINSGDCRAMWSGANNPLWIIRKPTGIGPDDRKDALCEIEEIKGDKMPVAVHERMDPFTSHNLGLNSGDRIYLFTDGYPDQFGGPKGKKYMHKSFKSLLLSLHNENLKEVSDSIEKELDNWMNGFGSKYEQVDDITVLGIQI